MVAYGIIAICLLIVSVLSFQLWSGDFIDFSYYPSVIVFTYISNLIVLPALLVAAAHSRKMLLPALVWLHFSMATVLLYFSQVYTPFTVTWATLILLSSIYYQWKGFWLSSLGLGVLVASYIFMFPEVVEANGGMFTYASLSVLVLLLTILTSYMFVTVIVNSQRKNRALMKSQESEFLQVTRLNTLLNSISDAVMTLNRYGRITSQNAAAQGFFDTNQSLIGVDIDKLLKLIDEDDEPVSIRALIDEIKSSGLRDDLSIGSGNDVRHLSIHISRIKSTYGDSEEYGVVLIIRDITKQKTLEEEKDEFISVTSHELRTPVAIAEGSLSNFLLMQERGAPKQKLIASAEAAHKQILYLANMINDLSTLSRAERGVGDNVEPIKVSELLHNLFNKFESEASEKGLKLNLNAEHHLPTVETSRLYLEEILQNFITNAIKYTKQGSVTFGAKVEDEGSIRFFVTDTGIGIDKSDIKKIFEKFYRSEDYRTRETSGTGLGLYVVAKLADKLDAKIDVESRFNVGSTFSFALKGISNSSAASEGIVYEADEKVDEKVSEGADDSGKDDRKGIDGEVENYSSKPDDNEDAAQDGSESDAVAEDPEDEKDPGKDHDRNDSEADADDTDSTDEGEDRDEDDTDSEEDDASDSKKNDSDSKKSDVS